MTLEKLASIEDLRLIARQRLPKFAFDFIDGGAEDEINARKNCSAFNEIELVPRYLIDVATPDVEIELFGKPYAVPFGVAPVGFLNMAWPGADAMVAKLAARVRMPYVVSTASSTPLEELAVAADGHAWFQFYPPRDEETRDWLLQRVEAAGYEVLVVTIDVSQAGKRDRDIRNGLKIPFDMTPEIAVQLLTHPRWAIETLKFGVPGFGNFSGDSTEGTDALSLIEVQQRIISARFDWQGLDVLREKWPGKLLLKGIMHPEDAALAVDAGCDGLVVSNHGGRQADYAPAAISMLPSIVAAVSGRVPVLFDSGVRRGSDIIKAKALGASCVLSGRAFAYGAAAGAAPGCDRAFEILHLELTRALGQLGCPNFKDVGENLLAESVSHTPR